MRRLIISALATALMAFLGNAAHAAQEGSAEVRMGGKTYEATLVITEKMISNDTEYSHGRLGYYVFVASAHTNGQIDVQSIENAANCTSVRPRFGVTKPTSGYFKFSAYAVYYGPYVSFQEAKNAKEAVNECVSDAYIAAGVIQRF